MKLHELEKNIGAKHSKKRLGRGSGSGLGKTSLLMPNSAQHMGMSRSDPPATPDAPQADTAASTHRMTAVTGSTARSMVWQAAMVMTVMVTAAPAILMVAPSGMDTE